MYKFTEKEARTVLAVFDSLMRKPDRELNSFIGSVTIEEMKDLYYKLHYHPFCETHGIKYEEMTEEDYIDAWNEMDGERFLEGEDSWDRWEVEPSRDDWDSDEDYN